MTKQREKKEKEKKEKQTNHQVDMKKRTQNYLNKK